MGTFENTLGILNISVFWILIGWFKRITVIIDSDFRRGILPSSSRLIKPGRAGSIAPSDVGQDSLQDESSLDGDENSEK